MSFDLSLAGHLTLVSIEEGLFVKRDDLFAIRAGEIAGGKLRQCLLLLQGTDCSRIVTAASIHSPQGAIVAYAARQFGRPCSVIVGGLRETEPLALARRFGAEITRCKSGRHTVLFAEARRIAGPRGLIVPFGMRPRYSPQSFFETCAKQVCNIPPDIRTIVVATGSGVTATIVAYGLWTIGRTNAEIVIINVGPDRRSYILETLALLDPASAKWAARDGVLRIFPLAQDTRFRYESPVQFRIGRVTLHPLYEAKAFRWFINNVPFDAACTLFWVTGPPLVQRNLAKDAYE